MTRILSFALLYCFVPSLLCLQWQTPLNDAQTIKACSGTDVTFPWRFIPDKGDVISSVQWFFRGQSEEMMAFCSHGSFVPVPAYSERVEKGTSGSLSLRHLTERDTGFYFIEVDGHDASGTSFSQTHMLYLNISAPLLTLERPLRVMQSPLTIHDDVKDQWALQLSCGDFTPLSQPLFTVEWLTPSGKVRNSSSYSNGQFFLQLSSPIEKGQYTCLIPDRFAGASCLPNNISSLGRATVVLDDVEVRLKLLESEQNALRHQNILLQEENNGLKHRLNAIENTTSAIQNLANIVDHQSKKADNLTLVVDGQMKDVENLTNVMNKVQKEQQQDKLALITLANDVNRLDNSSKRANASISALARELHMMETLHMQDKNQLAADIASIKLQLRTAKRDTDPTTISFHAQLASNTAARSGYTLVLSHVYNNNGYAYDNTTGVFTAPMDGTYFFIASTGSHNATHDAYLQLVVDGEHLASAYAHRNSHSGEMATCHGLANLTTGQRVWLKSLLDSYFNYADTFFTGFLINAM